MIRIRNIVTMKEMKSRRMIDTDLYKFKYENEE